jgi:hypothetical protein
VDKPYNQVACNTTRALPYLAESAPAGFIENKIPMEEVNKMKPSSALVKVK